MPHSLTPAEARVLLDPDRVAGRDVARTALMHLAALGHLRVERREQRSWGVTSTVTTLHRTGRSADQLPPHLRAVLDALGTGAGDKGLQPTEVVLQLQKAFGAGYVRLVRDHLRDPLVARGLLRREETRVLRIIPRTRHHATPEGERIRAELQAGIRAAEEIPALLAGDPARAAVAAAALGGALLVADGLRPHLAALADAVRVHQPALAENGGLLSPLGEEEEEARRDAWMDVVSMLAEVDWGTVLDALDGVADAFDAGDGGGADGGDGGGDGGGGGGGE